MLETFFFKSPDLTKTGKVHFENCKKVAQASSGKNQFQYSFYFKFRKKLFFQFPDNPKTEKIIDIPGRRIESNKFFNLILLTSV